MGSDYQREKIFTTLRKFDVEWSKDSDETFCEMFKRITKIEFEGISDKEMEDRLKDIEMK